jgi:hypothetical protein
MDKLISDPPTLHPDIAADANAERLIDSHLRRAIWRSTWTARDDTLRWGCNS